MKKFASLILALAMMFTLCISASATETIETLGGSDDQPVTLTVKQTAEGAVVYHVDVEWKGLDFTYETADTNGTWDPDTHTYRSGTTKGWKTSNEYDVIAGETITRYNAVTVTNHSNAAVAVTATANVGDDVTGITMATEAYNSGDTTLPSAVDKALNDGSLVVGFNLSVTAEAEQLSVGNDQEIGTVVVSIAAAD